MKLSNLIKEELNKILKELSVDEPKGGPFGKVLFSQDRTDSVVKSEPDEELEMDLLDAFVSHQQKGRSFQLSDIFDKVLKVAKSGKYKNLLQPPNNIFVYRISTNLKISDAAERLGMSIKELVSYADGNAYYVPLSGKPYKSRSELQSWTSYPSLKAFKSLDLDSEDVVILFEANTSNNNFLMNPKLSSVVEPFKKFSHEYETVAKNPVKLSGASFYVSEKFNKSNQANNMYEMVDGMDIIIEKLLNAANTKKYAKKPK